jgi:hypothetical protein
MRRLAKTGIALGSIVLACLVCFSGLVLFFAPFRLGLIPTETYPGTAARVALNLLPLAAMAAAVICAVLLSLRFYRGFTKRISN